MRLSEDPKLIILIKEARKRKGQLLEERRAGEVIEAPHLPKKNLLLPRNLLLRNLGVRSADLIRKSDRSEKRRAHQKVHQLRNLKSKKSQDRLVLLKIIELVLKDRSKRKGLQEGSHLMDKISTMIIEIEMDMGNNRIIVEIGGIMEIREEDFKMNMNRMAIIWTETFRINGVSRTIETIIIILSKIIIIRDSLTDKMCSSSTITTRISIKITTKTTKIATKPTNNCKITSLTTSKAGLTTRTPLSIEMESQWRSIMSQRKSSKGWIKCMKMNRKLGSSLLNRMKGKYRNLNFNTCQFAL